MTGVQTCALPISSLRAIYGADDWILVVGVSLDKSAAEIVGALAPSFDTILCTSAHHKGAAAASIATLARSANPGATVEITGNIEDAVGISQSLAAARHRKIYVAGGLFMAIEYGFVARGGDARDLNFF